MKIELTITEAKVLIDLLKNGDGLNKIKSAKLPKVKIGKQIWAKEDLKVTHFRNGEPIPHVQDYEKWSELETAAYCISPDGFYLYNWYAVNDPRGLAPEGWHVPTDEEWTALTTELGGEDVAGNKMKSSASENPSWNGNNSSGFSSLPVGSRNGNGSFLNAGYNSYWWSSSPNNSYAWYRKLFSECKHVYKNSVNKKYGLCVRCVKNY